MSSTCGPQIWPTIDKKWNDSEGHNFSKFVALRGDFLGLLEPPDLELILKGAQALRINFRGSFEFRAGDFCVIFVPSAPGGPKMSPRRPQEAQNSPRRPKMSSRRPQEA